ncbi:MAG: DUF3857 domain-containing protein [Candidatus Aminicenantes bacterium]|nr:MAG: DUF3857 domain-containing protein [Candidatus Aminicenantes bacterium]
MSKTHSLPASAAALCLATVLVVLCGRPAYAQKSWPPVSPEELAMKDYPQQPGAAAVILYREEITDGETFATSVFRRLKVLTEAGREYSNIEIPFVTGSTKITGIQARVVPPEGPAREFGGQIFDKTAFRYRKMRVAAKTFALPDVAVGSIIDYRYKVEIDRKSTGSTEGLDDIVSGLGGFGGRPEEGGYPEENRLRAMPFESWDVQDDLFTKKAKFATTSNELLLDYLFGRFGCRMAWVSIGKMSSTPKFEKDTIELELVDIPAYEEEEYSVPEETLRTSVDLFYISGEVEDNEEFWKLESEEWQKGVDAFLGKPAKLTATAQEIIGDATDPTEQLKRIYARVQGLRNLSYEKGLTRRQRKEQKVKDNRKVTEVLERGFGVRSDLTRTFVALARAAGLTADVVRVAARDNKIFRKNYLSFYTQLDTEVATVNVGDKVLAFDPATPFCPFGLVHWSRTNSAALRVEETGPVFFSIPVFPPDMALTQREIALTLDLQGNLAGTVTTTYTGQEALVRRLDHIHDDDAARREALEKELGDLLPLGASAKLTGVENIDNNTPSLITHYEISIPGIGTAAGEKMLLPVSPLAGSGQYPFRHDERKYPVYIPYPFRQFDDIIITLPEGLTAEVRPVPRKNETGFSDYSILCGLEAPNRLHIQRDLSIKKSLFPLEQYKAIKSFYDTVRTIDEEQIVLTAVQK